MSAHVSPAPRPPAAWSLAGKTAVVTGGSRGIGKAIATLFVEAGSNVVVASRKEEGVRAVADELNQKRAGAALPVAAHTGKEEDCQALVAKAVAHFGKVDVLVNNAGTNPYFGPVLDTPMAAWDKTFEVNLKGYFWMAREVARHLVSRDEKRGAIVNIASIVGMMAAPLQGVYGMTKAAVIAMTRTLAYELGPSGVRVNAISPGLVDTRLAAAIVGNDTLVEEMNSRTALRRVARPEEIAGAALYLASDASSFTTGEVLVVDGGLQIT
jgi:NAD(P)-dependent dehydrogenase (short-subunit alcohol dehydrogenase family)